jgi:hypothetical protein
LAADAIFKTAIWDARYPFFQWCCVLQNGFVSGPSTLLLELGCREGVKQGKMGTLNREVVYILRPDLATKKAPGVRPM